MSSPASTKERPGPGPFASVVEEFAGRKGKQVPRCTYCSPEPEDFVVVMLAPRYSERLGFDRYEFGLAVYWGSEYQETFGELSEASDWIEHEVGVPVELIEHESDATYWTAEYRPVPEKRRTATFGATLSAPMPPPAAVPKQAEGKKRETKGEKGSATNPASGKTTPKEAVSAPTKAAVAAKR